MIQQQVRSTTRQLSVAASSLGQLDALLGGVQDALTTCYMLRRSAAIVEFNPEILGSGWRERRLQHAVARFRDIEALANEVAQFLEEFDDDGNVHYRLLLLNRTITHAVPELFELRPLDADTAARIFSITNETQDLRNRVQSIAAVVTRRLGEPYHSENFTFVRWCGRDYDFNTRQAPCVQMLWDAWKSGADGVHQAEIAERAGLTFARLRDVFKGAKIHPAWGTMIGSRGKGVFGLVIVNAPDADHQQSQENPT